MCGCVLQVSKVPTAVLSTTAKAKERARKKEAEKEKKAPGGWEGGCWPGRGTECSQSGKKRTPLKLGIYYCELWLVLQ